MALLPAFLKRVSRLVRSRRANSLSRNPKTVRFAPPATSTPRTLALAATFTAQDLRVLATFLATPTLEPTAADLVADTSRPKGRWKTVAKKSATPAASAVVVEPEGAAEGADGLGRTEMLIGMVAIDADGFDRCR